MPADRRRARRGATTLLLGDGFGLGFGVGAAATGAGATAATATAAAGRRCRSRRGAGARRRRGTGGLHEQLGVHPRVLDVALEHLVVGGGRADAAVGEARIEHVRAVPRRRHELLVDPDRRVRVVESGVPADVLAGPVVAQAVRVVVGVDEAAAAGDRVAEVVLGQHVRAAPSGQADERAVLLHRRHAVVRARAVQQLPEGRLGGALAPARRRRPAPRSAAPAAISVLMPSPSVRATIRRGRRAKVSGIRWTPSRCGVAGGSAPEEYARPAPGAGQ